MERYYVLFFGFSQKGGSVMNFLVCIDWKFVLAIGAAVSGIILTSKINADAAEHVSTHVVDTCKEVAVVYCNR